jgi:hypothetical protein
MDKFSEAYGLTLLVKEANGLQLHAIATVALDQLKEINAECAETLKKQKAEAVPAAVATAPKEPSKAEIADEPGLPLGGGPSVADSAHTPVRRF